MATKEKLEAGLLGSQARSQRETGSVVKGAAGSWDCGDQI